MAGVLPQLNHLANIIAWLTVGASLYINLANDQDPFSLLLTLDRPHTIHYEPAVFLRPFDASEA
jgi:hypothetical protein